MFFLNSNDYYVYMLLGIYKNLLDTKTKYPVYCAITKEVNTTTKNILETVGINLIELDTKFLLSTATLKNTNESGLVNWYKSAFTKLSLFDTQVEEKFEKIVYLDTDQWIKQNIDEVMDMPHMTAVINLSPKPLITEYTLGASIFCSGMFVWDFAKNPHLGHNLVRYLDDLDPNVAWHDQSVLNYWYKDWNKHPELHLDYHYGAMNHLENCGYMWADPSIKVWHFTTRNRTDWPFYSKVNLPASYVGFKEWVASIANTIVEFNINYNLNIVIPNANNLRYS